MRCSILLLVCLALAYYTGVQAAVFYRNNGIFEHYKQLDLPAEEIDPDVAPLPSIGIEVVDETTDDNFIATNENALPDEADNEVDETFNEIPQPVVATTVATVTEVSSVETATAVTAQEEQLTGLAKYCTCSGSHCDCCREFNVPFIPVKGPGCARMTYLGNEKMSVSLKYGDLTLVSRTVSGRKARPICVNLPGGYSQFCGRIYGLSKAGENFKACMGFELRADDDVEAALRVSCFKFGPEGLRVAPAEPMPVEPNKEDDDDDDDIFGFGGGGDDEEDEDEYDEDDDDDEGGANDDSDTDTDYADDEGEDEAPTDADYGGFSLAGLLAELDDDEEEDSKPSSNPVASSSPSDALTRLAADSVQSKDDNGSGSIILPSVEHTEIVGPVALTTTELDNVVESSKKHKKKKKKHKKYKHKYKHKKKQERKEKHKKKKEEEEKEDMAYEIISGLIDFFS